MTYSRVRWAGWIFVATVVAGVLWASNMGFRVKYPLVPAGGDLGGGKTSVDGTSSICLPYRSGNLLNASDLINDVNSDAGAAVVLGVSRLNRLTNLFETYSGGNGEVDFPLEPGTGYRIQVSGGVDYYLVGSHNPAYAITLTGSEDPGSLTGRNSFCPPYNAVAATAGDLMEEINRVGGAGTVVSVARYARSTGSLEVYTGFSGSVDFPIQPGEGYLISTSKTVRYTPTAEQ